MVSSASFGPTCHTCLSTSRSTVTTATVAASGRSGKYPCNINLHSSPPPNSLMCQKRSWFDKSLIPLAASMTLLLSSYPGLLQSGADLCGHKGERPLPLGGEKFDVFSVNFGKI
ncbi:hypothetical protein Hdeb2414_s0632g00927241 [Helianthus debilis subsp. tardiflorus]